MRIHAGKQRRRAGFIGAVGMDAENWRHVVIRALNLQGERRGQAGGIAARKILAKPREFLVERFDERRRQCVGAPALPPPRSISIAKTGRSAYRLRQ